MSLILQDKYNIEIFLSPEHVIQCIINMSRVYEVMCDHVRSFNVSNSVLICIFMNCTNEIKFKQINSSNKERSRPSDLWWAWVIVP